MKIYVESPERSFTIPVPTGLIFNSATVRMLQHKWNKSKGKDHGADDDFVMFDFSTRDGKEIPPKDMKRLFAEIRRIKKRYGNWELLNVQAADGQRIRITL